MRKIVLNAIYNTGVVIAFLGISGIAEAITEHGSGMTSTIFFTVGLAMCLAGYVK